LVVRGGGEGGGQILGKLNGNWGRSKGDSGGWTNRARRCGRRGEAQQKKEARDRLKGKN